MILKKTLQMAPILLAITSSSYGFQRTELSFDEKDVSNGMLKINPTNYNKTINSFEFDSFHMENRIKVHTEKWRMETLIMSDIHAIIANENFQHIISIGERAIPFILNELKIEPSPLVWSLNIILNKKISNQQLSIKEASKAWVKWGIQNRIIGA